MKHQEKPFAALKIGAKFYHQRQLCIKTGGASYHVWSTGAKCFLSPDTLVRPVKASVRIEFYWSR